MPGNSNCGAWRGVSQRRAVLYETQRASCRLSLSIAVAPPPMRIQTFRPRKTLNHQWQCMTIRAPRTMSKSEKCRVALLARCTARPYVIKDLKSALRITSIIVVLLLTPAACSHAQNPRLELGRRLKRFENAWETAHSTQRVAAVPFLKTAVRNFFTLRLSEAGRQLDQAWFAIRDDEASNELTTALIGSQLIVSPLCAETTDIPLKVRADTVLSDRHQARSASNS